MHYSNEKQTLLQKFSSFEKLLGSVIEQVVKKRIENSESSDKDLKCVLQ